MSDAIFSNLLNPRGLTPEERTQVRGGVRQAAEASPGLLRDMAIEGIKAQKPNTPRELRDMVAEEVVMTAALGPFGFLTSKARRFFTGALRGIGRMRKARFLEIAKERLGDSGVMLFKELNISPRHFGEPEFFEKFLDHEAPNLAIIARMRDTQRAGLDLTPQDINSLNWRLDSVASSYKLSADNPELTISVEKDLFGKATGEVRSNLRDKYRIMNGNQNFQNLFTGDIDPGPDVDLNVQLDAKGRLLERYPVDPKTGQTLLHSDPVPVFRPESAADIIEEVKKTGVPYEPRMSERTRLTNDRNRRTLDIRTRADDHSEEMQGIAHDQILKEDSPEAVAYVNRSGNTRVEFVPEGGTIQDAMKAVRESGDWLPTHPAVVGRYDVVEGRVIPSGGTIPPTPRPTDVPKPRDAVTKPEVPQIDLRQGDPMREAVVGPRPPSAFEKSQIDKITEQQREIEELKKQLAEAKLDQPLDVTQSDLSEGSAESQKVIRQHVEESAERNKRSFKARGRVGVGPTKKETIDENAGVALHRDVDTDADVKDIIAVMDAREEARKAAKRKKPGRKKKATAEDADVATGHEKPKKRRGPRTKPLKPATQEEALQDPRLLADHAQAKMVELAENGFAVRDTSSGEFFKVKSLDDYPEGPYEYGAIDNQGRYYDREEMDNLLKIVQGEGRTPKAVEPPKAPAPKPEPEVEVAPEPIPEPEVEVAPSPEPTPTPDPEPIDASAIDEGVGDMDPSDPWADSMDDIGDIDEPTDADLDDAVEDMGGLDKFLDDDDTVLTDIDPFDEAMDELDFEGGGFDPESGFGRGDDEF